MRTAADLCDADHSEQRCEFIGILSSPACMNGKVASHYSLARAT